MTMAEAVSFKYLPARLTPAPLAEPVPQKRG
jgi:hypothetical protein